MAMLSIKWKLMALFFPLLASADPKTLLKKCVDSVQEIFLSLSLCRGNRLGLSFSIYFCHSLQLSWKYVNSISSLSECERK